MSAIVDFYRGTALDYLGRRLRDIWQWDDERLEFLHDYVQVLFPSDEESLFNAHAPLIDRETINAFLGDEELRRNLAASHDLMLRFYGLGYDGIGRRVVRRADFAEKARNWVNPYNHNYRRITRILRSLMALDLPERAQAFFDCLNEIHDEYGEEVGQLTFSYWQDAVSLPR